MKIAPPTPPPHPVPASKCVLHFPLDHYLHQEAPTEWWWHIGTLKAGNRTFGFEINAAAFYDTTMMFTQVMLTDVENKAHYQQTTPRKATHTWAQSDPSQDWWVKQGDSATDSSWVSMSASKGDPSKQMVVKAAIVDDATKKVIQFDLTLSQDGPPFIVYGTGEAAPVQPGGVTANNYYYSLTRLQASGTVSIGGEVIKVEGLTWMDHEYGKFGSSKDPVLWFLQDMQLDNGVHLSNFTVFKGTTPKLDETAVSACTIQFPDGTTYYENGTLTPTGRTWKSPMGRVFFLEFKITLPTFVDSEFVVTSLVDEQDFPFPLFGVDTYEGVAKVVGKFMGVPVCGTAWNEQQPAS